MSDPRDRNVDDRGPGRNGDLRSYRPVGHSNNGDSARQRATWLPNTKVRGPPRQNSDHRQNLGQAKDRVQPELVNKLRSEVKPQNSDPRARGPRLAGPGSTQPGDEILTNVLGEVLKIIESQAFIMCKIYNKAGLSEHVIAKYYTNDKRNFQDKVKLKDLKFGTMVRVSLEYSDYKRMWEASSLKIEMQKPKELQSPDKRPQQQPQLMSTLPVQHRHQTQQQQQQQQQPQAMVPENFPDTNGATGQTSAVGTNRPSHPQEMPMRRDSANGQRKSGPAPEVPQRWARHSTWTKPESSGRTNSEQGSLNPKSPPFYPRVVQPLSPVKPGVAIVKRYSSEVMYNHPAIIRCGPNPRLEFLDGRKKVTVDMNEDLEVECDRNGDKLEKRLFLEEVMGRVLDLPAHVDAKKEDEIWTLIKICLPKKFLTKVEGETFIQPILDDVVNEAFVDDQDETVVKTDDLIPETENPDDESNAGKNQVLTFEVMCDVIIDTIAKAPCDFMTKVSKFEDLTPGIQSEPKKREDEQLDLIVIDGENPVQQNLLEDVKREMSIQTERSSEVDFPLDEEVHCEVPILEPAIVDVSSGEFAEKDSIKPTIDHLLDLTKVDDSTGQAVDNPACLVDSLGSLADNPPDLVDNPTVESTTGLEKVDEITLKSFLQFLGSSTDPKAMLQAFMRGNQ